MNGKGKKKDLSMSQMQVWAYAVGVLGIGAINNLIGQFSFFYTDKVGLSAALAGSALLISKCADAFTDLVMGYIVDHTKSKYGKARPWMLWMAPFVLIAVIMLLMVPKGMSEQGKFIYAIVTNIFASAIVCTAISVPYGCLLTFRTTNQNERTQMNVKRAIVNYICGMFFSIGFVPLTAALGGTQKAWILVGVVIAAFSSICMVVTFKTTEEVAVSSARAENTKDEGFIKDVGSLLKNKYWVIIALAQLVANISYQLNSATNVYYAKWIFKSESIVGIMGAIAFLPTILGFFIIAPLVKKFGAVNVVKGGLFLGIIGAVGKAIFSTSLIGVCIFGSLTAIATMPFMMVGMVLVADVADFEEWKSGKQIVGLVNSASSFGAKVGAGIGAGLIGWVLALGGYQADAAVQSQSALNSIMTISIYIPGALILVLFILMCMFDMNKKYPNYREELMQRREG